MRLGIRKTVSSSLEQKNLEKLAKCLRRFFWSHEWGEIGWPSFIPYSYGLSAFSTSVKSILPFMQNVFEQNKRSRAYQFVQSLRKSQNASIFCQSLWIPMIPDFLKMTYWNSRTDFSSRSFLLRKDFLIERLLRSEIMRHNLWCY